MGRIQDVIARGTRAAQPAAATFGVGLYYVTDEAKIERSNGTAWEAYSATGGGTGDVVGPAVSVASEAVLFDGTTGKLLKRATGTGLVRRTSGVDAVGGVLESDLGGFTDLTTADVSITKHGLAPKLPNDVTKFLNGVGGYTVPAGGVVVQVVNTQTGAFASGTTVIPLDDTIPQITEGDEYLTLAITPTSATNKLKIDVVGFFRSDGASWVAAALFKDATANALAVGYSFQDTAGRAVPISFTHYMTAGTTSSITFRVRAGRDASAGTVTEFNGSGARLYGGVVASSITITELTP